MRTPFLPEIPGASPVPFLNLSLKNKSSSLSLSVLALVSCCRWAEICSEVFRSGDVIAVSSRRVWHFSNFSLNSEATSGLLKRTQNCWISPTPGLFASLKLIIRIHFSVLLKVSLYKNSLLSIDLIFYRCGCRRATSTI